MSEKVYEIKGHAFNLRYIHFIGEIFEYQDTCRFVVGFEQGEFILEDELKNKHFLESEKDRLITAWKICINGCA